MFCLTRFIQSVVSAVAVLLLAVSCSNPSENGFTLKGRCTDSSYKSALFLAENGQVADSVSIQESEFGFIVEQVPAVPEISVVRLLNPDDAENFVDLPVGIENGVAKLVFGERFTLSGTPLNEKIMLFLHSMSDLRAEATSPERNMDIESIAGEFSKLYCNYIVLNADNALGHYIYRQYGSHLSEQDLATATSALNKK